MDDVVMYLRGLVPGRRAGFALAIGAVSGWIAALAGMPLPWMLGPMIGNTLAAILSLPIRGPDRLRPLVIPVIGVMLGSAMTPEMFDAAGRYATSFALLLPFLGVTAFVSYAIYRRVGRYDPVTAFFSAMPGGLNDMLILGGAAGGNEKRIALAHAARVLLVILFVVLFYGYALDVSSTEVARGTAASALITLPLGYLQELIADRPGLSASLISLNLFLAGAIAAGLFGLGTGIGGYSTVACLGIASGLGGALALLALERWRPIA